MTNEIIHQYFAEMNTDKIIRKSYFSNLDIGIMVEVGGATPEYISMSRHFKLNNWRCIIEPNPKFVEQHKNIGNEVYQCVCSNEDIDNADFEIASAHPNASNGILDDHSFSAIKVKDEYRNTAPGLNIPITTIKVNIRKLNTILDGLLINAIDLLSIDVEGWELEVMQGFDTNKFKPKVIILENYLYKDSYVSYMKNIGYRVDKMIDYNYIFVKEIQ